MADFPSIQLPSSRERIISKPQLKHEFTSNKNQIRSKTTKAKMKWTLKWDHLPIADWNILIDHFADNSGSSFKILKDMIFETYDATVIYSTDELKASSSEARGHYSVEVQVEEL